ncbi:hypothetical protein V6N13_090994 [Hibiscus sabdariffa]
MHIHPYQKLDHSSGHCWDRNLTSESNPTIRFSSLFAPGPGLKISASPHTEHVSFLGTPKHHPPGTTLSRLRFKTFWSIRSSTGSSNWNSVAKASPLQTIASNSAELIEEGFFEEDMLEVTYCRLWFITVRLNLSVLQRMVGK